MNLTQDAPVEMDVLSAASLFSTQIDDNGFMPGDADFKEPEAKVESKEPVAEVDEEVEEAEEDEDADDSTDDDGEGDSEADEEKPEGDEKTPEEVEDPLFELTIGDDVYEVNLEELKSGYLRQEEFIGRSSKLEKEYTAKTEQLSSKEVQIEAELEALIALQNQDLNRYRNVNWQELKLVDPEQYAALRADFHDAQEKSNIFQARKNEMNALREQSLQIKHQAYLEEQQALALRLVPEFKDPAFQKEIIKHAEKIGYTEAEVRNIADARHLMLLNQARLYDLSQLKRKEALEKKVTQEVPKVTKPGVPKSANRAKAKAINAAASNLKTTGSLNAARDYFLNAGLI